MWTKFIFKQIDLLFNIPQNTYLSPECKRMAKNIVYNEDAKEICKLDIYTRRKNTKKRTPVFINIHGGGFVAGDKYFRRGFCTYVASLGFKVININYGLCPKYKYPDFLSHIVKAIKWCEENSLEYGLDMSKVIISGDSAGAYIASCICIASYNEEYRKMLNIESFNTRFLATALFCGPYIPTVAFSEPIAFNINTKLWTDVTGEIALSIEDLKKYKYFNMLDCDQFIEKDFPPTFITHSDNDLFCRGHAERLIEILIQNSVPVWEIHSLDDIHDWHEVMGIRSSRTTLHEFERFLLDVMQNNISPNKHVSITTKKGKMIVIPN